MSEWLRRPLTPEQLEYAAEDVRYLCDAWKTLSADVEEHGNQARMKEELAVYTSEDY